MHSSTETAESGVSGGKTEKNQWIFWSHLSVFFGFFLSCEDIHHRIPKEELEELFLFPGIADMLDGNKSSGTTWLVLSIFQAVTNFANRAEDMSESGSKKH